MAARASRLSDLLIYQYSILQLEFPLYSPTVDCRAAFIAQEIPDVSNQLFTASQIRSDPGYGSLAALADGGVRCGDG